MNWDRGSDIALDFTIANPMSLDNFPLTIEAAKRHLTQAEDRKFAKEMAHKTCARMRWGLQPAAFSPWGGAGPGAKFIIHETLKRIACDKIGGASEARTREFRETVSMAIAREVARQLSLKNQILDT